MHSKKGNIKTWLIFIIIIMIAFGLLFYLKAIYTNPDTNIGIEEIDGKSFAKIPELSEKQKAEIDNRSLNDALISGSIEDCEKITYDDKLKQECLDNLNYAKILKSGNESLCDNLHNTDLRTQCYNKIYFSAAMESFDIVLCEKISDDLLKNNCLNQIKVVMGRTAKNISDCDSITDSFLKKECSNNFYFSSSIKELDEDSCENITDLQLKSRCTKTVAQNIKVIEISKQTRAVAPKTTSEVLSACKTNNCKDKANYYLAFENKDLSYCNRITDDNGKTTCLKEQTENLDQYYLRIALSKRNENSCNKISNDSLKQLCTNSI